MVLSDQGETMNRYEPLNSAKIKQLQMTQFANCIKIEGTVPALAAGGSLVATTQVSSYGDFLMTAITGKFSRLSEDQQIVQDDGVSHLTMQLRDGSNGLELFDTQIPLDMFLTPGGVRTPNIIVAPAGLTVLADNPINFPGFPFRYMFQANSTVVMDMRNDSNYANTFVVALWGTRIISNAAVGGVSKLRSEV